MAGIKLYKSLIIDIHQSDDSDNHYIISAFVDDLSQRSSTITEIPDIPPIYWDLPSQITAILEQYQARSKPDEIIILGQYLFNLLFPPDPTNPLTQAFKELEARYNDEPYRFVMRSLPERLQTVPWETLHNGARFLALRRRSPFLRQSKNEFDTQIQSLSQLKVLLVSASPDGMPTLNAQETFTSIESRLSPLTRNTISQRLRLQRSMQIETLCDANRVNLEEKISRTSYDIICFAVHGSSTSIFLSSERQSSNKQTPFTANQLIELISQQKLPNVVLFIACETDSPAIEQGSNKPLASFAQQFISQSQIPAVVAMQSTINIRKSDSFTIRFFQDLLAFTPVDIAFAAARYRISNLNHTSRDAIAPVMYLQSRNSNVFRRNYTPILSFVATTIIVLLSLMFAVQQLFARQIDQRQSDFALEQETRTSIQELGQLSAFNLIYLDHEPSRPQITNSALWYTSDDGYLHSRSLKNPFTELIRHEVGGVPSEVQVTGDSVWVTSELSGNLTQVDLTDNSYDLETTFFEYDITNTRSTSEGVIFQSPYEGILYFVDDSRRVSEFRIPDRIFVPIPFEQFIWVVPRNGGNILRFDTQASDELRFIQLDDVVINVSIHDEKLWLLTSDNQLFAYDPTTLERVEDITVPQSVTNIIFAETGIYLTRRDDGSLYQLIDAQWVAQVILPDAIIDFQISTDFILATDDFNNLYIFDVYTIDLLNMLSDTVPSTLASYINDGITTWLPLPTQGAIIGIDNTTGLESRRLSPCPDPTYITFDGTNLWVTCPEAQTIAYGPSHVVYLDTAGFREQVYQHPPLLIDDMIWLVQEGTGDIVVYDKETHRTLIRINENVPLHPLLTDPDNLSVVWTSSINTQRVLRIELQPQNDILSKVAGVPPDFDYQLTEYQVVGEISGMYLIDDVLWVLHADTSQLRDAPNITLLNKDTLAEITELQLGVAVSGFADSGDHVWISAAGTDQSYIYELDSQTGDVIELHHNPIDTVYSTWGGILIDEHLYFMYGAPIFSITGISDLVSNFIDPPSDKLYAPLMYPYNLQTRQWEAPIDIPYGGYGATVDGENIWFLSTFSPVLTYETNLNTGRLYVLDTTTDNLHQFDLCNDTTVAYPVNDFVIVGCDSPQTTLHWFDRATLQLLHTSTDIGSQPLEPFAVNNEILVAFRDDDIVVSFDASTMQVLQIYKVGNSPSSPFLWDQNVWVHNEGDGTLQQIQSVELR